MEGALVEFLSNTETPLTILVWGYIGRFGAVAIKQLMDAVVRWRVLAVEKQYVPLRQSDDILPAGSVADVWGNRSQFGSTPNVLGFYAPSGRVTTGVNGDKGDENEIKE